MSRPTPALGQKQSSRPAWTLSALPPKADIASSLDNVRSVPIADSCTAQVATYAGPTCCFVTSFPTGNEQGSAMATVGSGAYAYEPVENWAKLPPGWSFKEIGGVGVDRHDNVF